MANDGRGNTYSYLGDPGQHPSSSPWLEKQQSANRKSKLLVRPSIASISLAVEWGSGEAPWPFAKGFVVFEIHVLGRWIDSFYSHSSSALSLVS